MDGWEQFPVRPLAILPGAYYELDGVPRGSHSWTAITGFWDNWGQRFSMYTFTGSFTQPGSGSYAVHIPNRTIQDLLSVPPANLGYWEGYYYDAGLNCYTRLLYSGRMELTLFITPILRLPAGHTHSVQREPAIFTTKFHVSSSGRYPMNDDGLLVKIKVNSL